MTLRFFRLLACQLLLLMACLQAQAADGVVEITRAQIEASEEGYKLAAAYSFDLSHGLEDALQHGVQLHFTTRIELTRPRWYWLDEKTVTDKATYEAPHQYSEGFSHVIVNGKLVFDGTKMTGTMSGQPLYGAGRGQ